MENVENQENQSEDDLNYLTPPELREKADDASQNLITAKSREKYMIRLTTFSCSGEKTTIAIRHFQVILI